MPQVLARTPYGVTVQQDDGTVVTLPPEAAPPDAPPDQGPVPDNAFAALPGTPPPTIDPNPGDGPVPEGAISADMMGAPPTAPPTAPVSLAPTETDQQLAGTAAPDAVSGAAPATPSSDQLADPFAPPPGAAAPGPAAPPSPLQPWEDEAQAQQEIGNLQAEAGRRAAQVQAETEKNIAKLQQERERIGAELAQQRADAAQALMMAAQAQAKFASKDPKQSLPDKVVTSIAVLLGAVGVALSRGQLTTNPVFEVMNRQAEESARKRTEAWLKYKDTTDSAAKAYDRIDKLTTSQDAYYATTIAAEKEQQALEIERQARLIGTEVAIQNGAIAAAKVRQEGTKWLEQAADRDATQRRMAAKDLVDARLGAAAAATAAKNARTSAYQAAIAARAQQETARSNAADEKLAAGRLDLDWAKLAQDEKQATEGDAAMKRIERDVAVRRSETSGPLIRTAETVVNPDGTRSVVVKSSPLINAPAPVVDAFGAPVLNPDGTPKVEAQEWHAPTPQVADFIRKKYAGTHELTTLLDQMTTLIEEHGHEPDFLKSPAWQEATQAMGQAVVKYKGPELAALGVIAGPDEKLIHAAIGTSDPTQFRDTTAGLRAARRNMAMSLNTTLHDEGQYTGSPIEFPDETRLPGGIASPEATAIKSASGSIPTNDSLDKNNISGTSGPAFNNQLFGVVRMAAQDSPEGRQQAIEGLQQIATKNPDAVMPIAAFALAAGVDTKAISPDVDEAARYITGEIDAGNATLDGTIEVLLGAAPGLASPATLQGAMTYNTAYQATKQRREAATKERVDALMRGER